MCCRVDDVICIWVAQVEFEAALSRSITASPLLTCELWCMAVGIPSVSGTAMVCVGGRWRRGPPAAWSRRRTSRAETSSDSCIWALQTRGWLGVSERQVKVCEVATRLAAWWRLWPAARPTPSPPSPCSPSSWCRRWRETWPPRRSAAPRTWASCPGGCPL